jgi:hydroxyacylglutathione hydrolase
MSTWAGWVIPFGSPVVLVGGDPAGREEAARRLIRVGYDALRGYLDGGVGAWRSAGLPTAHTPMIDIHRLNALMRSGNPPLVIDVRFDPEWRAGHLPEALHLEPGRIAAEAAERVPRDRPVVIHCGTGNRATVGLSLLERLGYRDLAVLDTGFGHWREAGYRVVEEAA